MAVVVELTVSQVIDDVLESFDVVTAQDVVVGNAIMAARQFRINSAIKVCEALKVKGVTALGISKAVVARKAELKAKRDAGEDVSEAFADDIAYTSDTGIGWLATVGVLFQLESGMVPTDVEVGDICADIRDAKQEVAKSILRRKGISQDVAYAEIHNAAEKARKAKRDAKNAAKTAEQYIKALSPMLDKALAMELSDGAVTLLELIQLNITAALDARAEEKDALAAEKAAREEENINKELTASLEAALLENAA